MDGGIKMATEEYAAFKNEWLPFDDLNILISWDIAKNGSSHYLEVVIYQSRHKRLVEDSVKIHKLDFEKWIEYMERYIHFDVYRDALLYIEHKWDQHWINLTWDDILTRERLERKEKER